MVICVERGADCLHMVQLMPAVSKHSIACVIVTKQRVGVVLMRCFTPVVSC